MPIQLGTGPGQYPPVIRYIENGEPADDVTFNRPHQDGDARTEAIRSYVDGIGITNIAGLQAALNGALPLHANLRSVTGLDFSGNPNTLFAIDPSGALVLVPNNVQGEANTASNVGSGDGSVFRSKNGVDLEFRTIASGTNVSVSTDGDVVTISSVPGEIKRLTKSCKNTTGIVIPQGKAVAWLDDGSITLADANVHDLSDICGITAVDIADGDFGVVVKVGNIAGILSGLGAKPGQWIYLSETPGEMSLTAPAGIDDVVLALGRAEPPDGVATGSADDLFLLPSSVSEGGAA